MFTKSKIIAEVKKYICASTGLYFQNNEGVYLDSKLIIECNANFAGEFYLNDTVIILQDFKTSSFELFNLDGLFSKAYFGFYNYLIKSDKVFFIELQTNMMSYIENEILSKTEIKENGFYIGEKYLVVKGDRILCCDLDGKEIWVFQLNSIILSDDNSTDKNILLRKYFGVWNDQIFFACNIKFIIGLELSSGLIRKVWSTMDGFILDSDNKGVIPKPESFVLDKANNILIGAINTFYFEIDLITDEIKYFDVKAELLKFGIYFIKQISNNPFTDEHLFLTAMMKQSPNDEKWSSDCLIAFNRKTHEIDWHYSFENASLGTNVPQISENKLFQLDSNNTLHIFQKTT